MPSFRNRIGKTMIAFGLLFALLFLGRVIYSFTNSAETTLHNQVDYSRVNRTDSGITNTFSNVASSKYEYKNADTANPSVVQVDQKYEKTANVSANSTNFEEDEAHIKEAVTEQNGIIQFQQKSGNEGYRYLEMQIGIPPAIFDEFVADLKEYYTIRSIDITKTDKTNEFRELNAKRATLSATRQSLVELKAKGGRIDEYISLENRILEIDEQLQNLGVQLGNFDAENEFCTVKFKLNEVVKRERSIGQHVLRAFTWTVEYYLYTIITLFLTLGVSYFLLRIWDRLKVASWFQDREK